MGHASVALVIEYGWIRHPVMVYYKQSRDGQAEKLNYTIDENNTAAQRYSRLFV